MPCLYLAKLTPNKTLGLPHSWILDKKKPAEICGQCNKLKEVLQKIQGTCWIAHHMKTHNKQACDLS
jgi:hypothetical protein